MVKLEGGGWGGKGEGVAALAQARHSGEGDAAPAAPQAVLIEGDLCRKPS